MPLEKYLDPERDRARRTQQAAPASGGVWDAVRREFSNIRNSAAGGAIRSASRMAVRMQNPLRPAFGPDPYPSPMAGVERMGTATNKVIGTLAPGFKAWASDKGPQAPADDRGKRLAMAGMAPKRGTEPYQPSAQMRPETAVQGGASTEAAPPGRAMQDPKLQTDKAAIKPSAGAARRSVSGGGVSATAPMQVAPQDRAYMQENRPDDARAKYLKMAGMSLEDREKMLASMPEGQRPIHVIRGTKQSWYAPGQSREFETLPEAVTGVEGRPTYGTEQEREQKSLERQAGIEKQRFASEKAAEADIKGAQIRAGAALEAARISAKADVDKATMSAKSGGKGGEEWTFHETADGTPILIEKKGGKAVPIILDDESKAAGVLQSIGMSPEDLAFGASVLERMPRDVRNKAFALLSQDRKELFYQILENKTKEQKK